MFYFLYLYISRAIDGLLHEAFNQLRTVFTGRRRYGSLLLCGQSGTSGSGCGKTSILKLIARKAMSPPYYAFVTLLDCTTLRSEYYKGQCVEPVIFRFHRKPERNLDFETRTSC